MLSCLQRGPGGGWKSRRWGRGELYQVLLCHHQIINSGATDIDLVTLSSTAVERAIAQCTNRWAMARGHHLNTSIVLAAVHGLSGLFRAVSAVEPFTLSSPSHSVPVPNRTSRVDIKQHESTTRMILH